MTSPGGWWQIRQPPQPKHEPCCDVCSEPLCRVCKVPMSECGGETHDHR